MKNLKHVLYISIICIASSKVAAAPGGPKFAPPLPPLPATLATIDKLLGNIKAAPETSAGILGFFGLVRREKNFSLPASEDEKRSFALLKQKQKEIDLLVGFVTDEGASWAELVKTSIAYAGDDPKKWASLEEKTVHTLRELYADQPYLAEKMIDGVYKDTLLGKK